MNRALLALAALALAGCATTCPPPPPPVRIEVPIPTPCVPASASALADERAYPDAPDALRAAADLADRVRLILAGREQRDADLERARAALRGCVQSR